MTEGYVTVGAGFQESQLSELNIKIISTPFWGSWLYMALLMKDFYIAKMKKGV